MKTRSFLNSVKWAYTANWGERGFSALFMFILAAVLGPHDFGVLSIAWIYITFLQLFLDQGLVAALIQKRDLLAEHLDAVFWMDLALSAAFVLLSIVFGHWWAIVNHAPEVRAILLVLSLCIPIEGMAVVQKALLSREMDFKSLSIRSNASMLVGGIVGLGMAFTGFGVWALVGQQLTKDLTALVLLWRFSPWRPRARFSWKHLRELMGFSLANFVAQLGVFAEAYTGSIVLGLLFGPLAVGLYRLADRMMSTVVSTATGSIQWVSLPEFSRLQDKPAELRTSVLTCIRLSSTITLPALAGLAAVSAPLMASVGPQWTSAAGVLRVLCALGVIAMLTCFTTPLLQSVAKVRLAAVLEWSRTLSGMAVLIAAGLIVRHGSVSAQIMAIATARFLAGALVVTPVFVTVLFRLSGIHLGELLRSIAPSALSSVAIVCSVLLFHVSGLLSSGKPILLLGAELAVGLLTGLPVLLFLDSHLRLSLIGWIRGIGLGLLTKRFA